MRLLLALLSILPLTAAWDYNVISGASHGAIASRTIGNTEYTYIAYRDSSGALALSKLTSTGALNTQTIWPGVAPSNTYVAISSSGTALITFFSGNKFRYAVAVYPGNGNCGPASEWQCGDVLLPGTVTGTTIERVVGDVDSLSRAHFLYALRPSNTTRVQPGLYYTYRTAQGFWSTPVRNTNPKVTSSHSPVSIEMPSGTTGFGRYTLRSATAGQLTGLVSASSNFDLVTSMPAGSESSFAAMPRNMASGYFCTAGTELRALRRTQTGAWDAPKLFLAAKPWCSITMLSSTTPAVAYLTLQDVVTVSVNSGTWNGTWAAETVDASAAFSKPELALNSAQKMLLLYQGSGFLKLARQQ